MENDNPAFYAPSYGDIEAGLNKYGDVRIEQEGQVIIIKRDDFTAMCEYLFKEWDLLDSHLISVANNVAVDDTDLRPGALQKVKSNV